MNYRALSAANLADFAENIATLLGGTDLSAIDSNVRTDLLTLMGTLPADLSSAAAEQIVQAGQSKAATATKDDLQKSLLTVIGQVRNSLVAGLAPADQYALCQFDIPVGEATGISRPAPVAPNVPTGLACQGYSNGQIIGGFNGQNPDSNVRYEIWRLQGDTEDYMLHAVVTKQKFVDDPTTPGQLYQYKVRAVGAGGNSAFSNVAVVYGVGE